MEAGKLVLGNAVIKALSSQNLSNGFQYLNQNPVAEVAFLDVTTMVAPRTAIDYQQNPVYGTETLFREVAPIVFNPFGPGIVAVAMLAMMHKGDYKGVNAGVDAIDNFHNAWKNAGGEAFHTKTTQVEKTKVVKDYFKEFFKSTTGIIDDKKEVNIGELDDTDSLLDKAAKLVLEPSTDKKAAKKAFNDVAELYTEKTGAAGSIALKVTGAKNEVSRDIHGLLTDAVALSQKVFTKATSKENLEEHVKNLNKLVSQKTAWGIGLTLVGIFSLPYINNTITKLRTGKDGYAAYKDFCKSDKQVQDDKKEKNKGLWAKKALAITGMALLVVTTMGGFANKGAVKGFMRGGGWDAFKKKIQLKEANAHMDLIKLIYGTSLIGRFLFSRDDQELKVTAVRDYSGFLNWLVLGGFVAKGVAHAASKKGASLVNITGDLKGSNPVKTVLNWLGNVSKKSHSEVRAMIKNEKMSEEAGKKLMAIHNASTFAGLAYSMFALGIGMPLFCNHLTNKAREKQLKEKLNCGCSSKPSFQNQNPSKPLQTVKIAENDTDMLVKRVFDVHKAYA